MRECRAMRAGPDDRRILSVSQLTKSVRFLLEERYALVWVEGEISNLHRPSSGHWYFTLKDDRAHVRCAMFASRNRYLRFKPEDGNRVVVRGRLSLYEPRGDFQLIADHIELGGEGELRAAFEALKAKLAAEGLFAPERKVPLPTFPRHVAVITSASGAALRDVLSVLRRRCPVIEVTLLPVAVQGKDAQRDVLRALAQLDAWPTGLGRAPDVAVLARGGGSLEDLWTFNLESVARAIAACRVPIVSAVGHETDFTIADYAADARAPTPSAGAELVAPHLADRVLRMHRLARTLAAFAQRALAHHRHRVHALRRRLVSPARALQMRMQRIDDVERSLSASTLRALATRHTAIAHLRTRLLQQHPRRALARNAAALDLTEARLQRAVSRRIVRARDTIESTARALHAVSPLPTLARGYAVLTRPPPPGRRWGIPVTGVTDAAAGETIVAFLHDGRLTLEVQRTDAD